MRRTLLLAGLILLTPATLDAQDEGDKVVFGKRASEWFVVLRDDKEVINRRRALIALESAGPQTRKIFEELGLALSLDPEEVVRVSAAQAIGRLAARAVDTDQFSPKLPIKPGVDALIAAVTSEKTTPAVREAAASALGRIGPDAKDAVPALAGALKDPAPEVRAAAAEALTRLGPEAKGALSALARSVRESKGKDLLRVRQGAVSAIRAIGRPDGVPAVLALIEVLKEPEVTGVSPEDRRRLDEVRRMVVETLGVLGDAGALPVLTRTFDQALADKDASLARTALHAMTQLEGDRKALIPILIRAMSPPGDQLQDRYVRSEAMHVLSRLGKELGENRESVLAGLRVGLRDKVSEVKVAAILAIGELGPDFLGEELKEVVAELTVLRRSGEKAVADAADNTLKRLEK